MGGSTPACGLARMTSYNQGRVSLPSQGRSVPDSEAEPMILEDAERFLRSGRFERLWVDVEDASFGQSVAVKKTIFNFVERADTVVPAGSG